MRKISTCLLLCFTCYLQATELFSEDLFEKKVRAHIAIGDIQTSIKILSTAPIRSKKILELELEAYAALCDEGALIQSLKAFDTLFPDEKDLSMRTLDTVCWSIIKKACKSSSIPTRYEGLLAAFLAQDAKGIAQLYNGFSDSSLILRNFCTHLAKYMRDDHILEKVHDIFLNDPSFEAKILAIQAIGSTRFENAKEELFSIFEKELTREEKGNAILAFVEMDTDVSSMVIEKIYKSPHASLRMLSLELILSHLKTDCIRFVIELTNDATLDVRIQALQTLGVLCQADLKEFHDIQNLAEKFATSDEAYVSLSSLWILLRNCSLESTYSICERFKKWINSENPQTRLYAIAALCHAGPSALPLLKEIATHSNDPYAALNASLALLKYQKEKDLVKHTLIKSLDTLIDRIGMREFGIFSAIGPSHQTHDPLTPRCPETEDLMTRLRLVETLAICDEKIAQDKVLHMLSEKTWGVSANAMALLLQEGPLSSLDLIKPLLYDPSPSISLQAALFLSSTTQDKDALSVLVQQYKSAPIETKEMILFALGQMHSPEAIGFLRQVLVDRSQILRIKAATAILQCINH